MPQNGVGVKMYTQTIDWGLLREEEMVETSGIHNTVQRKQVKSKRSGPEKLSRR